MEDLKKKVDLLDQLLEKQKFEFEEAAKCCVEAIHGMCQRLERIEKWMLEKK